MLKSIILSLILTLSITVGFSQGIKFDSSIQVAVTRSLKEGKLLFIDVYTTWCGPCKWLDKEVFPTNDVGIFFNANFINLKLNAETDEAKEFLKNYKVAAYPTFIFLDSSLSLVYKSIGAAEAPGLVAVGQKALRASKSISSVRSLDSIYHDRERKQYNERISADMWYITWVCDRLFKDKRTILKFISYYDKAATAIGTPEVFMGKAILLYSIQRDKEAIEQLKICKEAAVKANYGSKYLESIEARIDMYSNVK